MKQNSQTDTQKSYDWVETSDGKMHCSVSEKDTCRKLDVLVAPAYATLAHDEVLMRCTTEINAILRKVQKNRPEKSAHLHLLNTHRGLLLAWGSDDSVDSDDDASTINKAFGIT